MGIALKPGEEFEEHQYARHFLGTEAYSYDGRHFVYGKMGAVAGAARSLYQTEIPTPNHTNVVCDVARAVGAREISATLGATAALVGDYDEGVCVTFNGAGEGYQYPLAGNPGGILGQAHAAVASSGILTAKLAPGYDVQVALDGVSDVSFYKHPVKDVIIHDSPPTGAVVGLCQRVVTADYYCWLQTKGHAAVLAEGTPVIGELCRASESIDGAITGLDYDESARDEGIIGRVLEIGLNGETAWIALDL